MKNNLRYSIIPSFLLGLTLIYFVAVIIFFPKPECPPCNKTHVKYLETISGDSILIYWKWNDYNGKDYKLIK